MNATVGGTVGGIQSGDAITKIEIVWKSGAETEAQAMSAGRGVVLTAAGDITAFQNGTYILSSANLVSGQTYTPAVRVTESRSGVDGFVGGWSGSAAFVAQNFKAEFSDSVVDASFSARLYGSGAVSVSGGSASISAPAATDAAVVRYDSALPTNKVFTITVKGQGNGADVTNMDFIGILQQATAPAPTGTNDAALSAAARLTMVFRPGSGYLMQYQETNGNWLRWLGSSWGAGAFIAGPVSGTQYVYQLQSNGTQFRMTLFAADGTTVITQSSWVNWSSVKNDSNSLWLYVGDMNTEWNTCDMTVDYIRIS